MSDEGMFVQLRIEAIGTVRPREFPFHQLQLSTAPLAVLVDGCCRLLAARSSFGIALFGWMGHELRPLARIKQQTVRITDVQFCPYAFPELAFCCVDGSLHVVDLEHLTEQRPSLIPLSAEELPTANQIGLADGWNEKCLCIYGLHPRQILMSLSQNIYSIDRSAGEAVTALVVSYGEGEQIQCMQTTGSCVVSPVQDSYLLAVLTNKRVRLHDLRTLPDTLLSWDVLSSFAIPDTMQFSLELLRPDEAQEHKRGTHVGRIVYGDRVNGEFRQAVFLIGEPQMAVSVQREDPNTESDPGLQLSRVEMMEDGIPLCHTRFRRYLDIPSTLCHSLGQEDGDVHSRALHLVRYGSRLQKTPPTALRSLPTVDIQRWGEFLQHEVELLGFQILPLPEADLPGLLLRMNPIGDLIIHQLQPRSGISSRKAASRAETARRVIREGIGEIADDYGSDFGGSTVDLRRFELDVCPGDLRVRQPETVTAALKMRYGIPRYLMSSLMMNGVALVRPRLKRLMKDEALESMANHYYTVYTPLPMTFHTEHFKPTVSSEISLDERMLVPDLETEVQKALKMETGKTLWRCIHEVRWNSPTMVQDLKPHRKRRTPEAEDGGTVYADRTLVHPVTAEMSDARQETMRTLLSLTSYDSCLADQRELKDVILECVESSAEPTLKAIRVTPMPPAAEDGATAEWKSLGESYGADIVLMPVVHVKGSQTEAKMAFGEAKFRACVDMPLTGDADEAIREMESLWRRDWNEICHCRTASTV